VYWIGVEKAAEIDAKFLRNISYSCCRGENDFDSFDKTSVPRCMLRFASGKDRCLGKTEQQ
jgi:hypothetical protein